MPTSISRVVACAGSFACLLSACSGEPGAVAVRPAVASVVAAGEAQAAIARREALPVSFAASEARDVSADATAGSSSLAAAKPELASTMERELGTASDGGYHAYPSY